MNMDAHREYEYDLMKNFCLGQCEMIRPSKIKTKINHENLLIHLRMVIYLPGSLQCVRKSDILHLMQAFLLHPLY